MNRRYCAFALINLITNLDVKYYLHLNKSTFSINNFNRFLATGPKDIKFTPLELNPEP